MSVPFLSESEKVSHAFLHDYKSERISLQFVSVLQRANVTMSRQRAGLCGVLRDDNEREDHFVESGLVRSTNTHHSQGQTHTATNDAGRQRIVYSQSSQLPIYCQDACCDIVQTFSFLSENITPGKADSAQFVVQSADTVLRKKKRLLLTLIFAAAENAVEAGAGDLEDFCSLEFIVADIIEHFACKHALHNARRCMVDRNKQHQHIHGAR